MRNLSKIVARGRWLLGCLYARHCSGGAGSPFFTVPYFESPFASCWCWCSIWSWCWCSKDARYAHVHDVRQKLSRQPARENPHAAPYPGGSRWHRRSFIAALGQTFCPCPAYKEGIQRTFGCTPMRCRCGCHFCFGCGLRPTLASDAGCRPANATRTPNSNTTIGLTMHRPR